jgi:hypothetical protein
MRFTFLGHRQACTRTDDGWVMSEGGGPAGFSSSAGHARVAQTFAHDLDGVDILFDRAYIRKKGPDGHYHLAGELCLHIEASFIVEERLNNCFAITRNSLFRVLKIRGNRGNSWEGTQ